MLYYKLLLVPIVRQFVLSYDAGNSHVVILYQIVITVTPVAGSPTPAQFTKYILPYAHD